MSIFVVVRLLFFDLLFLLSWGMFFGDNDLKLFNYYVGPTIIIIIIVVIVVVVCDSIIIIILRKPIGNVERQKKGSVVT